MEVLRSCAVKKFRRIATDLTLFRKDKQLKGTCVQYTLKLLSANLNFTCVLHVPEVLKRLTERRCGTRAVLLMMCHTQSSASRSVLRSCFCNCNRHKQQKGNHLYTNDIL